MHSGELTWADRLAAEEIVKASGKSEYRMRRHSQSGDSSHFFGARREMSALGRREVLFGAGGGVMALPWLELNAAAAKQEITPLRFASFYSPNGFCERSFLSRSGSG